MASRRAFIKALSLSGTAAVFPADSLLPFVKSSLSKGNRYGVTFPIGTCFSVDLGGHITGGEFGVIIRQFGLCVEFLQAVSLVNVDENKHVVSRTFDLDNLEECDSRHTIFQLIHFDGTPPPERRQTHGKRSIHR